MKARIRMFLVTVALLLAGVADAVAQGSITPVDRDDEKPQQPTLHYYDKHGNALESPVLFLAELDTVKKVRSAPNYPLYNGVSVGVNFFDALMKIGGQSYSSFDVNAMVSIHNWFFPVVEAGLGFASSEPDNGAYHLRVKPSPYLKVGMNYNFLYKSNPDYQFFLGLRAGVALTSYDITAITPQFEHYDYWGAQDRMGMKCTSWYADALAGLKVKIAGPVSLGWTIRYHFFISRARAGQICPPWFVPGYGHSPLGGTFSIYWTFGQKKSRTELERLGEGVGTGDVDTGSVNTSE